MFLEWCVDFVGPNEVLCVSDAQVGGLRDRGGSASSVDTREGWTRVWFGRVRPVPDAGELQANVSLVNADKSVADGSQLPRTTES